MPPWRGGGDWGSSAIKEPGLRQPRDVTMHASSVSSPKDIRPTVANSHKDPFESVPLAMKAPQPTKTPLLPA